MCSIWNGSHGIRKPTGKQPLDREIFLSKNKEQRGVSGWIMEGCVHIVEMLLSSLCHLFDRVGNESRRIQLVVNECMKV